MQRVNPNRQMQPAQQTKMEQATNGQVYVNKETYVSLKELNGNQEPLYVQINGYVVRVGVSNDVQDNAIALNKFQRQIFRIDMVNPVQLQVFTPPIDKEHKLANLKFNLECIQVSPQLKGSKFDIDDAEFINQFRQSYERQYFRAGQVLLQIYQGCMFTIKIVEAGNIQLGVKEMDSLPFGLLVDETEIELQCKHNQVFGLKQAQRKVRNIFVNKNFKFEEMGIGGLDEELANIFRRAFAARRFPPYVLKKYGINHVKGLLLYGPPGTGKTLIARKLAKALNSVEPKIVNGPEILSQYVGKAEENIRELFADAKREQQEMGDDSQLHIIIFDEMDAICKQRGREQGAGGSAKDGVVNQLLSMIDGVESLNNILVIGMTNRKDLLDEAILRPGRFEVHVEISLPNEEGRQQILKIHTQNMVENKVMHSNVSLEHLAHHTKNFTGAEIESLVKSATSFAFNRVHNIMDFNKTNLDEEVIVEMKDFDKALSEIKPAFGFDEDKFDIYLRQSLVDYGQRYQRIQFLLRNAIQQTKTGKSSQINSVLLEGDIGTGKTAIAAWAGKQCEFPFIQIISPENFVGFSENGKINAIVKVFEDAYKSPLSCIILDNIERLIEFIDMGPRFSNGLLQALLVLIKKAPKNKDNRLLVIGTSSQARILKDLEITNSFNINITVPPLESQEIVPFLQQYKVSSQDIQYIISKIDKVPVKQLQMILDMLEVENSENNQPLTANQFLQCYNSINLDNM